MAPVTKDEYKDIISKHQSDVREMVLAGLNEIKEGKTKDFNKVCERLEKKYKDAAI